MHVLRGSTRFNELVCSHFRGVDPSSTFGYDLVAHQRQLLACAHMGVGGAGCLRGDVPPQKLENVVFLS